MKDIDYMKYDTDEESDDSYCPEDDMIDDEPGSDANQLSNVIQYEPAKMKDEEKMENASNLQTQEQSDVPNKNQMTEKEKQMLILLKNTKTHEDWTKGAMGKARIEEIMGEIANSQNEYEDLAGLSYKQIIKCIENTISRNFWLNLNQSHTKLLMDFLEDNKSCSQKKLKTFLENEYLNDEDKNSIVKSLHIARRNKNHNKEHNQTLRSELVRVGDLTPELRKDYELVKSNQMSKEMFKNKHVINEKIITSAMFDSIQRSLKRNPKNSKKNNKKNNKKRKEKRLEQLHEKFKGSNIKLYKKTIIEEFKETILQNKVTSEKVTSESNSPLFTVPKDHPFTNLSIQKILEDYGGYIGIREQSREREWLRFQTDRGTRTNKNRKSVKRLVNIPRFLQTNGAPITMKCHQLYFAFIKIDLHQCLNRMNSAAIEEALQKEMQKSLSYPQRRLWKYCAKGHARESEYCDCKGTKETYQDKVNGLLRCNMCKGIAAEEMFVFLTCSHLFVRMQKAKRPVLSLVESNKDKVLQMAKLDISVNDVRCQFKKMKKAKTLPECSQRKTLPSKPKYPNGAYLSFCQQEKQKQISWQDTENLFEKFQNLEDTEYLVLKQKEKNELAAHLLALEEHRKQIKRWIDGNDAMEDDDHTVDEIPTGTITIIEETSTPHNNVTNRKRKRTPRQNILTQQQQSPKRKKLN